MRRKFVITVFLLLVVLAILITANKSLFNSLALEDSVEIQASPEEIWGFFHNLGENYSAWHPKEHVTFKWIKGDPMELGSSFYAEEYALGDIKQYNGTVVEAVPNRKIVFALSLPISIMTPKFEWRIEPKGPASVFSAVTYVRAGDLLRKVLPQTMEAIIESGKQHMSEEGINLKQFLEEQP
jgi:hypothetical protein